MRAYDHLPTHSVPYSRLHTHNLTRPRKRIPARARSFFPEALVLTKMFTTRYCCSCNLLDGGVQGWLISSRTTRRPPCGPVLGADHTRAAATFEGKRRRVIEWCLAEPSNTQFHHAFCSVHIPCCTLVCFQQPGSDSRLGSAATNLDGLAHRATHAVARYFYCTRKAGKNHARHRRRSSGMGPCIAADAPAASSKNDRPRVRPTDRRPPINRPPRPYVYQDPAGIQSDPEGGALISPSGTLYVGWEGKRK